MQVDSIEFGKHIVLKESLNKDINVYNKNVKNIYVQMLYLIM